MGRQLIEEAGQFQAVSDDGEAFTVVELQAYTEFRPLAGETERVPTTKSWRLTDGRGVNYIDAETFKIFDTGQIIRKVD